MLVRFATQTPAWICPMLPMSLLLFSCASGVLALYEEERAAALAAPPAIEDSWKPEVRLRLSDDALDGLVQSALDQGLLAWKDTIELDGPLGISAKVTPSGELSSLSLSASQQCDGCLEVDARLKGKARWSAAGASGQIPFTAKIGATMVFAVERDGSAWAVEASLEDVDRVQVGSASIGSVDATGLLGDWVSDALKRARPLDLGVLGGAQLPLRAARVSTSGGQVELQLLTDVPEGSPVSAGGTLSTDFDLRVSTDTVLALARREAFETGAIAMDVAAVPSSLQLDDSAFTMGLRLWKLTGAGWWRDYSVTGELGLKRRRITLEPTGAVEGEKSRGAGLADPLALLAEGQILDAIEEGMHQVLPGSAGTTVGSRKVTGQVTGLSGGDGVLTLSGSLSHARTDTGGGRTLQR